MNFDEICTSSFSSVSPKFWKFSSQRVRTRWDLAETPKNFFFEFFFEVEKMGQNCIFRILSEDFSAFFNRCCGNFELLGRDGSVFYPKVKKESKNLSIQTRTSRGKFCDFYDASGGLFPLAKLPFQNGTFSTPAVLKVGPSIAQGFQSGSPKFQVDWLTYARQTRKNDFFTSSTLL